MRKIIAKKALTQQELNSAYAQHTCDTSQQSLRLRFHVHDKTMRRNKRRCAAQYSRSRTVRSLVRSRGQHGQRPVGGPRG
jgi:hypothetical protein